MTEALTTNTGVLEHVDPNNLMIEMNVRTEASITPQFVASIQENGVLVPIVGVRDESGNIHVRAGQRRTLAAREAGLASVPVYITDARQDTETRLVQQITENDQRLALGAGDRVVGIQQLLDTGLSVTKVAKRLAVSPERVKQSKAVAGSATAMEALHGRTATLAEAAGIAEFDGDEGAVERLLRAAGRNYFDQELGRLRQAREDAVERDLAIGVFTARGFTVLKDWPTYGSGNVPLASLLTASGEEVDESVVENPQHWAVMLGEESVFTDAEGNRVAEELIDWATEDDPDAVAQEGMIHRSTVTETTEWTPSVYFCTDPEGAGLTVSERYAKLAAASAQLPDGAVLETSEDLAKKAVDKAERRKVIALNKAGTAAEAVRRKFVQGMLKRKSAPDGAMLFLAQMLTKNGTLLGGSRGDEVAGELLGADVRTGELLDHATDGRASVVALGLMLGALESLTPKSAWRGGVDERVAYLRFLAGQGYGLSPVEQVVVGDLSADDCLKELGEVGEGELSAP